VSAIGWGGGPPVYEFCLEDGKRYAEAYCQCLKLSEQILQSADVLSIGKGGGCQGKIVDVGTHQPSWDPEVKGRKIVEE